MDNEKTNAASEAGKALSKLGASKGGHARASALSPEERSAIAKNAAEKRWGPKTDNEPQNEIPMGKLIQQAALTLPIAPSSEATPVEEGETKTCLFKTQEIRTICHHDEWWYSVVDVVGALSQSSDAGRYWPDLKAKLLEESGSNELLDEIEQLKMLAKDGAMRLTDCANAETIFRIIQTIPSPHAEPFKKWLARTAYERILEIQNPEIAIKRAIATYQLQGRDNEWIRRRLETIVSRNELTNEWKERGINEGVEYAVLTDDISKGTFGLSTKGHKKHKSLSRSHNLRDHMTGLELVLTMLGEEATKEIAINTDAIGFSANQKAAKAGGSIAGNTRREIEEKSGKKVLSKSNFLAPRLPDSGTQ